METVEIAKDNFLKEIDKLLHERPDSWRSTTSKTCFMFDGKDTALTICDYLDSNNISNISICTINNAGYVDEKLVISSKIEPEDYTRFKEMYIKVKSQVQVNIYKSLEEGLAGVDF